MSVLLWLCVSYYESIVLEDLFQGILFLKYGGVQFSCYKAWIWGLWTFWWSGTQDLSYLWVCAQDVRSLNSLRVQALRYLCLYFCGKLTSLQAWGWSVCLSVLKMWGLDSLRYYFQHKFPEHLSAVNDTSGLCGICVPRFKFGCFELGIQGSWSPNSLRRDL